MVQLAEAESISHRNQLGQQPGSGVPQPLLALDISPAWRVFSRAGAVRCRPQAGAHAQRPPHRTVSLHVLLAQHPLARRGSRAVLYRDAVSGIGGGSTGADLCLENPAARDATRDPARWRTVWPLALLPR